jgi:transposase
MIAQSGAILSWQSPALRTAGAQQAQDPVELVEAPIVQGQGAMRAGLERLAGWVRELGVTQVGMESTGVCWMPVYAVLEAAGGFELIVVNAQHAKAINGRKTDMKDAEWLGQLVRHGLVRGSFVPPLPIRELRDLTRYRRTLVEAQGSERRRLIKLLELAGIKLAGVVSDIFGVSGRAILRALIEGGLPAAEMSKQISQPDRGPRHDDRTGAAGFSYVWRIGGV